MAALRYIRCWYRNDKIFELSPYQPIGSIARLGEWTRNATQRYLAFLRSLSVPYRRERTERELGIGAFGGTFPGPPSEASAESMVPLRRSAIANSRPSNTLETCLRQDTIVYIYIYNIYYIYTRT
jgi:hypothetical protein